MVKKKTMRLITGFTSIALYLFIALAGLKLVFKWDWGDLLFGVGLIVAGLYLIIESGIRSFNKFVKTVGKPNATGLFHLGSFALGFLLIYISVTQLLPIFNLPLLTFNGWILLIGGVWAIFEGFVK